VSGLAAAIGPWLARLRQAGGGGGGALALEQVLSLDPRRRLCLVRCGARKVLLLVGGPQDCVVGWLDPEDSGAPPA